MPSWEECLVGTERGKDMVGGVRWRCVCVFVVVVFWYLLAHSCLMFVVCVG